MSLTSSGATKVLTEKPACMSVELVVTAVCVAVVACD